MGKKQTSPPPNVPPNQYSTITPMVSPEQRMRAEAAMRSSYKGGKSQSQPHVWFDSSGGKGSKGKSYQPQANQHRTIPDNPFFKPKGSRLP